MNKITNKDMKLNLPKGEDTIFDWSSPEWQLNGRMRFNDKVFHGSIQDALRLIEELVVSNNQLVEKVNGLQAQITAKASSKSTSNSNRSKTGGDRD